MGDADQCREPHEDLPTNGGTHQTTKTSDQKPRLRRPVALRAPLSPSKLYGEMLLAEPAARRAREHAIGVCGLPAGFIPPR